MNPPRKPSPAILVAVLALVAALAGTAVAGPDASTSALSKKSVKKLVKKEVAKQIGNAVGPPGAPGASGLDGAAGSPGAPGTAIAFAAVEGDGTLTTGIPGSAFNITQAQVSKEATGFYCFKIPGVRSVVATVSDGNGGVSDGVATVAIGGAGCPSGQGFTAIVQTNIETAGTLGEADLSFFVWFQ
jgi:hypothetical protein